MLPHLHTRIKIRTNQLASFCQRLGFYLLWLFLVYTHDFNMANIIIVKHSSGENRDQSAHCDCGNNGRWISVGWHWHNNDWWINKHICQNTFYFPFVSLIVWLLKPFATVTVAGSLLTKTIHNLYCSRTHSIVFCCCCWYSIFIHILFFFVYPQVHFLVWTI